MKVKRKCNNYINNQNNNVMMILKISYDKIMKLQSRVQDISLKYLLLIFEGEMRLRV